ncbi:MAG: GFA family protein [Gammaproteobacteria bacterium]|nr:GFA family protein [Gammaproteobacteria bacterium]
MTTHSGGCHCGRIRFEIDAPADIDATECNCSICSMSGFLHLFVSKSQFRLLSGEGDLSTYTFGSGIAQHNFCRRCGVKSFYVPRSHPDGYSVNVRCLDPSTISSLSTSSFDGRNWEQNVSKLSPLND